MKFSHFFVDRPIFAAVLSMVIFIAGAIALGRLPISEYPEVVPPNIDVHAVYPGANPKVIAETVAAPLEEAINGVETQQYIFRQPGIDWQIWIAKGDKPAPVRVVVVASEDPARPQFQADLTWDTTPQFAADSFVFTPPAEAWNVKPAVTQAAGNTIATIVLPPILICADNDCPFAIATGILWIKYGSAIAQLLKKAANAGKRTRARRPTGLGETCAKVKKRGRLDQSRRRPRNTRTALSS